VSIGSFILRRLGSGALSVLGVSILVFLFLHMIPGDPVDNLLGPDATPDNKARVEKCMGLDKSMPEQFVAFLGHVVDGTLGPQCRTQDTGDKRTVAGRIGDVLPYTVRLAVLGMLLAVVLALPLGVLAAARAGGPLDALCRVVALLGVSLPGFWLGLLLVWTFAVRLGWLPAIGGGTLRHLVLPALTLAAGIAATQARLIRACLLETLGQPYIQVARAKGLREGAVLLRHALRNALIAPLTALGVSLGRLLGGAVVVETVFAYPGLGKLAIDAISTRDYPLIQAFVVLMTAIFIAAGLLVDLCYAVVDPRVRVGGRAT
jgi:peptide/nickel transport system permease protein